VVEEGDQESQTAGCCCRKKAAGTVLARSFSAHSYQENVQEVVEGDQDCLQTAVCCWVTQAADYLLA
jgi:hypothetical protein